MALNIIGWQIAPGIMAVEKTITDLKGMVKVILFY
jgi:hypothetical protein